MFNVADLSPYHSDDSLADLRIKSLRQGENDGVLLSQGLDHDHSSQKGLRISPKFKGWLTLC